MYIVYKHTSPSNKVYIGITSQIPNKRWQNGNGYKSNEHFWRAIQKYGWDNFKHEILFDSLTQEEACKKETELILFYNSYKYEYGYNITLGGECCLRKRICMYTLHGEFIKCYNSSTEIELDTGISSESILFCCNKKTYSAGDYLWRYDDENLDIDELKFFKINENNHLYDIRKMKYYNIKIYQYSLKGELLHIYDSIYHIPDINSKERSNIIRCANMDIKTTKGYTYRFERDYDLEANGVNRKPLFCLRKRIKQYDLNGNLIKTYNSIKKAEQCTNIKNINMCLSGKRKSAGNYVWRYSNDNFEKYPVNKKRYKKKRKYENIPVYQYDFNGNLINIYSSVYDIPKEFGNIANIQKCLLKKIKSVGKYLYSFNRNELLENSGYKRKTTNKKVYQYTIALKLIAIYDSVSEAHKITGINHISSCARGERKSAGGYVWSYKEVMTNEN